ncbi:hypothetical protein VTK73DRAFT_9397 [Phialemonium thermophilum]|uniref:DNA repair metallo-beta-lactamase domain-containing protein n=1 Tax=Phialemonium thermophilum TaxID=223376 RepID=A0ABR3XLE6_9PEZI
MRTARPNSAPQALGKSGASKLPAFKKNKRPNASILNYFKKSSEDQLFLGDGQATVCEVDEEENIYDLDEVSPDQTRYNEVANSCKKRRLTPPLEEPPSSSQGKQEPLSTLPRLPRPTAKKISNNPFVDDSSDDDEEPLPEAESLERDGRPSHLPAGQTWDAPDLELQDKLESGVTVPFGDDCAKTEEVPGTQIPDEYGNMDDDLFFEDDEVLDGEEWHERRYIEEQARLEAEAGGDFNCQIGVAPPQPDDTGSTSCPVCNGSLHGMTADQATTHVNSCLDGHPTPLPSPAQKTDTEPASEIDAPDLGKRFARAALPRPGQTNPISLGDGSKTEDGSSFSAFTKLMSGHAEDTAWAAAAAAEHSSRGKPAYQRTCPFYKIMPGFSICVDAFRYGAVEGCKAYFLSHFHSDHYVGLTANWSHGPIYCSKVTGSLVKSQLRTAAKYVVELDFEKRTAVPGIDGVTVTMIPANHCPGSSLFLFEKSMGGRTQRILHCGDFRACPAHVNHPQLRPETVDAATGKNRQQKIDVCYLDTTYLNPRYSFPPQEDVIRTCAEVCSALDRAIAAGDESEWDKLLRRREGVAAGMDNVRKFFPAKSKSQSDDGPATMVKDSRGVSREESCVSDGNDGAIGSTTSIRDAFTVLTRQAIPPPTRPRLLVVCGTYSIGKERICKAIAQALGTKIFAAPAKARIVAQLDDPELTALLTSDPTEAQVHMHMLGEIRAETLSEYLESLRPHFTRVVGFRPSGWNFRPTTNASSGGGISIGANMPPSSVSSVQLLHGLGWRTRFGRDSLRAQRGSTQEAVCFGVPYSEHSSFRELALFLMALRIERVVPTVNVGSEQSRRRMRGWIDRWLAERRRGGLVRVLQEDAQQDSAGVALWEGKNGRGGGVYW